jgi:co-chaperonin GroES (HSP10)|tara:strand:+ start:11 stop:595 length:585 start_codon:yes stop_codon:yes gene_type:complete
MQTLNFFVVEIPKRINDTVRTESGFEIFIDPKFNEFKHRTTEAEVVSSPIKYKTGVKKGDTLYFHHLVVVNDGQPLTGIDDNYIVKCDPDYTIGNQAFAYKSKKTGKIKPLFGWAILEAVEEHIDKPSEVIEVITLQEKPTRKGRVAFDSQDLKDLKVKKGDVVGFAKDMDYRIMIDDNEYYRVRSEDLLYVEK